MKYKLINFSTKEEHLCDKVTIDGFDYYVSDEIPKENNFATDGLGIFRFHSENPCQAIICNPKKVIATNNPNIDIPKVVDEVEILLRKDFDLEIIDSDVDNIFLNGLTEGYNKSKETHPFSDEDMMEFADWVYRSQFDLEGYTQDKETKKLFQIWKEQQPKIIYYQ